MIGFESSRSSAWKEDRSERRTRPGGALLPLRVIRLRPAVPFLLRGSLEKLAARLEGATAKTARYEPRTAEELARRVDVWLRAGWPLVRPRLPDPRHHALLVPAPGRLPGLAALRHRRRRWGRLRKNAGSHGEGHCWLVRDGRAFRREAGPAACIDSRDLAHAAGAHAR